MRKFETILVGTDFSELAEIAVQGAVDLARAAGAKRVHLVHVVNTATAATVFPYSVPEAQLAQAMQRSVDDAQGRLASLELAAEGFEITRKALLGPPGKEIAAEAERVGADVIVAASHGYGPIRRTLIGSVTSTLIRTAHCPVLIVGQTRRCKLPFHNVMASVDLSGVTRDVLAYAVSALGKPGRLSVLSLFEHPLVIYEGHDVLPRYVSEEEIARMGEEHAMAVRQLVDEIPHDDIDIDVQVMSKAPAAQVVLETAQILEPDLVVLGTSGHNAWHRMILGSTATRVIAEAACPVLVVPHDVKHDEG